MISWDLYHYSHDKLTKINVNAVTLVCLHLAFVTQHTKIGCTVTKH